MYKHVNIKMKYILYQSPTLSYTCEEAKKVHFLEIINN